MSDNDGIFAKAWNRVCNAFLKFVCNVQLWALEKKMNKAYKEPQEGNKPQEPNDNINKKGDQFVKPKSQDDPTPNMDQISEELEKK